MSKQNKQTRIRIFVRGGCVQDVFSTSKDVAVELIDFDSVSALDDGGDDEQVMAIKDRKLLECERLGSKWRNLPV